MTHSPVVAPRQVGLLVSPLSGTIGATIDGMLRPEHHGAECAGSGPPARPARSTNAMTGR